MPIAAIQNGPQGAFTWVVMGNNTAEPRSIAIGPATGDLTIVTSGLAEGERVAVAGQYKLQSKVPVAPSLVRPSAPTQAAR